MNELAGKQGKEAEGETEAGGETEAEGDTDLGVSKL